MANAAIATPNLLTDPGFLYWAPLGFHRLVAGGVDPARHD
jgi:hypothetical protein